LIGYVPLSGDLSHPGDRRRFCFYAKKRGIDFEIADPSKKYDAIVLSQGADLSQWRRYPADKGKIIFDFVDSYLAISQWKLRNMFRGIAKFTFRRHRYLHFNFQKLLKNMCRRSDAVICTTLEQQKDIQNYCDNVHIILDIQSDSIQQVKSTYQRGKVFNLVWEGFPTNIKTFATIREALLELKTRHPFSLHLVTDLESPLGLNTIGKLPTKGLVRKYIGMDAVYLYEWNEMMFPYIVSACDLALIPISPHDKFAWGKPENKLVLFWRMGLPAVTSDTPAYHRAMEGSGLSMTCRTTEDWVRTLEHYMSDAPARQFAGEQGKAYAEKIYGEEVLLNRWDQVFSSLGIN
jgi:glycosyltransferase involved in cell wall biosynthesis